MISDQSQIINSVGVVVIGRNEGDRLKVCLESVVKIVNKVVYVDSGSTDNSIELARNLGIEVVNLDVTIPFTAARARNEGFYRLLELKPDLSFVQFVDGDCEVVAGWIEEAESYLVENSHVAIVCGRRRERYPSNSIYNMLCDIEWNTSIGEAKACGGDALMRANVLKEISGFNSKVIAGEEPELCVRVREQGWKVWRLDFEMTVHDANIISFNQWWKRNVRSGYAFALGAFMHGNSPERHWIKEVRRGQLWALYIPIIIISLTIINPLFISMMVIYPLQVIRVAIKNSDVVSENWKYSFFVTLGKVPEFFGQLKFYMNQLLNTRSKIIEYK